MKVKIKNSCAGVFEGQSFAYYSGQIVAVPDELAKDLLRAGYAETVKPVAAKQPVKRTIKRG